jgi:ribosomal protein S18 acetylase RimI-like enzyme
MNRRHAAACDDIVRSSEPWKTLREGVDFLPFIRRKQAFAAVIEGAVAGFVVFTSEPVFARGGYLRAIAVAPAVRGFGVGRRLLAFAERTTAAQAPNFFLCVSSFNREGQAFYRKCGYVRVGRIEGLLRKGAAEIIYWKRLRNSGRRQNAFRRARPEACC